MSGACGYPRAGCCNTLVPPSPVTNPTAQVFSANAPGQTALAWFAPSIGSGTFSTSLDSLRFTLRCESNVTLTFPGTLYYSSTATSNFTVKFIILLTNTLTGQVSIPNYQVPQQVTLVPGHSTPITPALPIVLPPGTYNAYIQLQQVNTPTGSLYLDGVMYESYVRTYV